MLSKSDLKKILFVIPKTNRKKFIILIVFMIIGAILEMMSIGMILPLASFLGDNTDTMSAIVTPYLPTGVSYSRKLLITISVSILLLVFLIKTLFMTFLIFSQSGFAFKVQSDLSRKIFSIYLNKPYLYHTKVNTSVLVRNTIGEVNDFISSVIIPLLVIVSETFVLFGLLIVLISINPTAAISIFSIFGLVAYVYYLIMRKKILEWGKERQIHEGKKLQHTQQGLGGIKDIKMLGMEDVFVAAYDVHNKKSANVNKLTFRAIHISRQWLEFITILSLVVIVYILISQGNSIDSILPIMAVYVAVAFRLLPSINRILSSRQSFEHGIPITSLLYKELSIVNDEYESNSSHIGFNEKIEFNDVDFNYPDKEKLTLSHVNFQINKGDKIGIVGRSGSGKSTLVDLLIGIISPTNGRICIDNHDINNNVRSWQRQIGYVPQSIYLADDTIRNNIAFGVSEDDIDNDAMSYAITFSRLNLVLESLSDGLNTMVGERGICLSGGQLQRIGIARALYNKPEVLVLDEATSSLDIESEAEIIDDVISENNELTVIIISHRIETLKSCDFIYNVADSHVNIVK